MDEVIPTAREAAEMPASILMAWGVSCARSGYYAWARAWDGVVCKVCSGVSRPTADKLVLGAGVLCRRSKRGTKVDSHGWTCVDLRRFPRRRGANPVAYMGSQGRVLGLLGQCVCVGAWYVWAIVVPSRFQLHALARLNILAYPVRRWRRAEETCSPQLNAVAVANRAADMRGVGEGGQWKVMGCGGLRSEWNSNRRDVAGTYLTFWNSCGPVGVNGRRQGGWKGRWVGIGRLAVCASLRYERLSLTRGSLKGVGLALGHRASPWLESYLFPSASLPSISPQ
jgi:hypothetical protein